MPKECHACLDYAHCAMTGHMITFTPPNNITAAVTPTWFPTNQSSTWHQRVTMRHAGITLPDFTARGANKLDYAEYQRGKPIDELREKCVCA